MRCLTSKAHPLRTASANMPTYQRPPPPHTHTHIRTHTESPHCICVPRDMTQRTIIDVQEPHRDGASSSSSFIIIIRLSLTASGSQVTQVTTSTCKESLPVGLCQ